MQSCRSVFALFPFNGTATPAIYTLSLHDALPISSAQHGFGEPARSCVVGRASGRSGPDLLCQVLSKGPELISFGPLDSTRSEEHTSELQSHSDLVCRLLLEKKKKKRQTCTMGNWI